MTQKNSQFPDISVGLLGHVCFLSPQIKMANYKRDSLFLSIQIPQSELYLQVLVDTTAPVAFYLIFKLLHIPPLKCSDLSHLLSGAIYWAASTAHFFSGAEIVRLFLIKFGS